MQQENSYIDRSYCGTHNNSKECILRELYPYLCGTTNRCFTIQYVIYPKRQSIYTPYDYKGSTTIP